MLVVVGDAMGARDETNGDDARGKLDVDGARAVRSWLEFYITTLPSKITTLNRK